MPIPIITPQKITSDEEYNKNDMFAGKMAISISASSIAATTEEPYKPQNVGHAKTPAPSGSSTTLKFPSEPQLNIDRYVAIKIYDTSEQDPNEQIAAFANTGASAVVSAAKSAFNGLGAFSAGGDWKDVTKKLGGDSITGIKDVYNTLTSSGDSFVAHGESLQSLADGLKDFGNISLNSAQSSITGEPIYKDMVWLPIPNGLSEGISHNYHEGLGFIAELDSELGNHVKSVIETGTKYSKIVSKGTGTQALSYNENKLLDFTGSQFRTINLSWTLIANSAQEAKTIQEIILKLKAYSSPQAVAGKMLLRAPFFCKLEFQNKHLEEQLQFKECVITNINVNYSTDGDMMTFHDGKPKTITLDITIKDREPKTLQNWADDSISNFSSGGNFNTTSTTSNTASVGAVSNGGGGSGGSW